MHQRLLATVLPLALAMPAAAGPGLAAQPAPRIHSVCDLSQQFSFYLDGRFHTQYLQGVGRDARNWGSLHRLDLSNVNLLVVDGGDPRLPYSSASLDHVVDYVERGGTLLVMLDGGDPMPPAAGLTERFGVRPTTERAATPLRAREPFEAEADSFRGGTVLDVPAAASVLLEDRDRRPVLAVVDAGEGHLLVGSRGLFGHQPDAKDPIHAAWITPLLVELATTKSIDPKRPHRSTWAEHARELGPLTLEYHDGTEPFAVAIAKEYERVRPHLVAVTGVEPAPGMLKNLLILPTGGGGFSSGQRIAIGAWWGDYPDQRYPMVELIGHEAGHSWVLPHAEPLWNEPIATWLGIQVGKRLGMEEADQTLQRQIRLGRRHDPQFDSIDPLGEDAPRDLIWGKSYFVFEELERRFGPGAMAKYFRTKRRLVAPDRNGYSMDDCVAVWGRAVGEDLFDWFRGLAFDVDPGRSDLAGNR